MADIVFDNVTKRYPDGHEAVKSINLEIAALRRWDPRGWFLRDR